MRTLSAQQAKVFAAGNVATHLRVSVKDASGTFRDLTTYAGVNLVLGCDINASVDSQFLTASVRFQREIESLSLSPLVTTSPLNLGFNPLASYAPLLALTREIKVEVAYLPEDVAPVAGDWFSPFWGYIDSIDWGDSEISVECRDLGARLQDKFVEVERVYSFGPSGAGCRVWSPSVAFVVGEYVIPTTAKLSGHYYQCTTAGTTASTEPASWPTSGTVTSGGAVFTRIAATTTAGVAVQTIFQALLDDNLGAGVVSVYTPTAPGWNIGPFLQKREPLFDAIRTLANQIGWDVRYKWDNGTQAWRFTFWSPDRAKTTPDQTFTASQYLDVGRIGSDRAEIRNKVAVIYSDAADLDTGGAAKRKAITVSDSASITKYGTLFCEFAEESTSNIDTSTEATTLANNALADLKEPNVGATVDVPFFPFVELADLYRIGANGRHFNADQDLAVTSYTHKLGGDDSTSLTLSGKPSTGRARYFDMEASPGINDNHVLSLFNRTAPSLSVEGHPGSARIVYAGAQNTTSPWDGCEIHVSTSSGFTPVSGTLKMKGKLDSCTILDLPPGVIHYVRAIPYGLNAGRIVRGEPTAEVAFTPGFVEPYHTDPDANLIPLPANGDFAGAWKAIGSNPPDRWAVDVGSWPSSIAEAGGGESRSGARSIVFGTTADTLNLISEYFPVIPDQVYACEAWSKVSNVAESLNFEVKWYSAKGTLISTSNLTRTPAGTTYALNPFNVVSPDTAKWARVRVGKRNGTAHTVTLDDVRLRPVGDKWHAVGGTGEPAFANSWVNYGGGFTNAAFMRDPHGFVHLRGWVKNGTIAANIFVLPVGYRPVTTFSQVVLSNGAVGRLDIGNTAAGNVYATAGSNVYMSLDGITFMADV